MQTVLLVIKQRLTHILTQTLLYYLNIFRLSGVCLLMCICNTPVLFLISPPFSLYPLDKDWQKHSQTISIIPPFVGVLQLFGRKLLLKVPVLRGQLTIKLGFCNGPCHTHTLWCKHIHKGFHSFMFTYPSVFKINTLPYETLIFCCYFRFSSQLK